jgi:hypothetical protein
VGVAVGADVALGRGVGASVPVVCVVGDGNNVGVATVTIVVVMGTPVVVVPSGTSVATGEVALGVVVASLPSHATSTTAQPTKKIIATTRRRWVDDKQWKDGTMNETRNQNDLIVYNEFCSGLI